MYVQIVVSNKLSRLSFFCSSLSSVFEGNVGIRGGTVAIAYIPVAMLGRNDFTSNTGPALRVRYLRYRIMSLLSMCQFYFSVK